jgi:hypothetical protein
VLHSLVDNIIVLIKSHRNTFAAKLVNKMGRGLDYYDVLGIARQAAAVLLAVVDAVAVAGMLKEADRAVLLCAGMPCVYGQEC